MGIIQVYLNLVFFSSSRSCENHVVFDSPNFLNSFSVDIQILNKDFQPRLFSYSYSVALQIRLLNLCFMSVMWLIKFWLFLW